MNLGLYFDLRNPPQWRKDWSHLYRWTLDLCSEADRQGIHSLWFTEHHGFDDGYLPQPLSFATAVSARTQRARLGTSVLIAGLRPAALIAEEAAIADILSGGRLDLGLGAGYRCQEFELYRAKGRSPRSLLFERIAELRAMWRDGQVTPGPVQKDLPIWVGVTGERSARRAGELGEGLMGIGADLSAAYREGIELGRHDRSRGRIVGPANVFLSDDPERDWPLVRPHLRYQWTSYRRHRSPKPATPPPFDPDSFRARGLRHGLMGGFLLATPQVAAAQIAAATNNLSPETVYVWATLPGLPHDIAERNVELATELATHLADGPSQ